MPSARRTHWCAAWCPSSSRVGSRSRRRRRTKSPVAWLWGTDWAGSSPRSGSPVLVILEDLHHAPPGGLGLLEPFATAALTGDVVIAASSRDFPSAAGLTAVPGTRRIALEPLTDAEATNLVRNIDPSLAKDDVASVVARAEGNPFFLAELTRLAGASEETAVTTPAVRDVVLRRVDGLGDGARDVLAAAALIGRKPSLDLLYAVIGDADRVDDVIDNAEQAKLVEVDGKVMRWNHDLVRESLAESLRSNAKRRWHGRIADALGKTTDNDVFQHAHHTLASGASDDRTADLGEAAAVAAAAQGAHEEALRWLNATLEAIDSANQKNRAIRLEYLAGRALIALQRYPEGKERLLVSARAALRAGDGPAAAAALMGIGAERLAGLPDYEPPLELLHEALALVEDDPAWTCRLLGRSADVVAHRHEAIAFAQRAIAMARHSGDPNLLITALGRILITWHDVAIDEHAELIAEIQMAAEDAGPEQQWEAQAFTVLVHMVAGDLEKAAALVPIVNAGALRLGLPRALFFDTTTACIHMLQGRFAEAQDVMQDNVAATSGSAAMEALAVQASLDGIIAVLRGDFSDFMPRVQMFLAMTAGRPDAIRVHPFVALGAQLSGDHETARASIDEAFRIGFGDIFKMVWGLGTPLAMLMVEALCAYGDDRAQLLESHLVKFSGKNGVGGMAPALVFGAVDHHLALIARQRGDHAEARRLVDAAVALHRRMGALPFLARSLLLSAEIADRDADSERATDEAREAARLAARFELRQIGEWAATLLAKHGAAPVRGSRVTGASRAIVFTDIESSTASAAALGDAVWFERLRHHDTTIRKLVAQHGGREVKHLGDGFMLTFPTAHAAVEFGLALPSAFPDGHVRVRAGVHVGPVIEDADDVFGTTVNVAARCAPRRRAAKR